LTVFFGLRMPKREPGALRGVAPLGTHFWSEGSPLSVCCDLLVEESECDFRFRKYETLPVAGSYAIGMRVAL